jgi:TetR/AcrR family transcriptional regulator, transcriptional repressor for nem operon
MATKSNQSTGTRTAVLDSAERLIQDRGFNGFSYGDIAGELGVTKAALHYHFAGKAELGGAVLTRYAERFTTSLSAIDASDASAPDRLAAYCRLYRDVLRGQGLCLCGMLAAEYRTLPPPMRDAVVAFFDANDDWLSRLLEAGRNDGSISFQGPAEDAARMIVGALEGAMLVTRPSGDVARFESVVDQLLLGLQPPRSGPEPA